jgi:hypothetical protein
MGSRPNAPNGFGRVDRLGPAFERRGMPKPVRGRNVSMGKRLKNGALFPV